MNKKIELMASRCKNRGGDCPCVGRCQAVDQIESEICRLTSEKTQVQRSIDELERTKKRLLSKPATLRKGFEFDSRYVAVMVFDGDEAYFGYEDAEGEWIAQEAWPFNEDWIWPEDCRRHGIRVE